MAQLSKVMLAAIDNARRRKRRANRTTTTVLTDVSSPLNADGKFNGRRVIDTTALIEMIASGPLAADDWVSSDGTTTVTPG